MLCLNKQNLAQKCVTIESLVIINFDQIILCLEVGERTSPPPAPPPPPLPPRRQPTAQKQQGQQQPRTRTISPPYIYTYTNVNSVSGIELNNYCTISVD